MEVVQVAKDLANDNKIDQLNQSLRYANEVIYCLKNRVSNINSIQKSALDWQKYRK